MKQSQSQYEKWLAVIANTRLIFNTIEEMEDFFDCHSIHSNGIRRSLGSDAKIRSAFRNLKEEVRSMTVDLIALDTLMVKYQEAWDFYVAHLRRRSNPFDIALELLNYCYPPFIRSSSPQRQEIFRSALEQEINIPLLILILLKAFPGFNSKGGDVSAAEIEDRYDEVITLLERFTEGGCLFSIHPTASLARAQMSKSRIMLLYHVSNILDTYESYVNASNLYSTATELRRARVDLDIEGYWNEANGELRFNDFWQIEATTDIGAFFATHWTKTDRGLDSIRYAVFVTEAEAQAMTIYVIHPVFIKHRMAGLPYTDSDHVWYVADRPSVDHPDSIMLTRILNSLVWKHDLTLTRVVDPKIIAKYDRWRRSCEINKLYGDLEYSFYPNLYAVTRTHLYIPAEEEGKYFRIPRDAGVGFDRIQMGDNVGVLTMDGGQYLVFDELLLYISTRDEDLRKYNIERVGHIS